MTESYIQKRIAEKVKKRGGLCIKLVPMYLAGLPDLMILISGRVYFIEVKKPGGVLSKIQIAMHKKFNLVGFKVWVVYDSDVEKILDNCQVI